jgi:hypothetical protein
MLSRRLGVIELHCAVTIKHVGVEGRTRFLMLNKLIIVITVILA